MKITLVIWGIVFAFQQFTYANGPEEEEKETITVYGGVKSVKTTCILFGAFCVTTIKCGNDPKAICYTETRTKSPEIISNGGGGNTDRIITLTTIAVSPSGPTITGELITSQVSESTIDSQTYEFILKDASVN